MKIFTGNFLPYKNLLGSGTMLFLNTTVSKYTLKSNGILVGIEMATTKMGSSRVKSIADSGHILLVKLEVICTFAIHFFLVVINFMNEHWYFYKGQKK